jgi:hypothetical protein
VPQICVACIKSVLFTTPTYRLRALRTAPARHRYRLFLPASIIVSFSVASSTLVGVGLILSGLGPRLVDSSVSADNSLFLAIRRTPTGSRYLWSIYTIASGDRVAELRLPDSSAQSFFSGIRF